MPDREQEFEAPEQSHTASASGESPTPFSETGEQLIRRTPMGYVWNQAGAIWLFLSLLIFEVVIRRSLPKGEPVADAWWTVAQFAAYAAHTRTPEFAAALDEVLAEAAAGTVAVMCSESVWWRCHRRLIADVAVLGRGVPVTHLMPDGRLRPHEPSAGAVLGADGAVRWPG